MLEAFTYTYDDADTCTSMLEPGPVTHTWGYDNAYRLTTETRLPAGFAAATVTHTYDEVGNRTVQHGTNINNHPTTYSYDAANQLTTSLLKDAVTTYTYDANGNLEVENVDGTRTTHTWNDENQLTQVQKTGMTTNQYTFNGDGQRVQIVDSQGTKKPIWDLENILLETDGSNVTQVVYTLEPAGYGNLVSQRRGSTTSFYLFDALGSTRKLTSSAGAVTDSYEFRAYGDAHSSSGTTVNVFRWVGELGYYYDINRLAYYLRARPYNPALARFLSQDPIGFVGSPWNLYEYVRSSPVNIQDPSGLQDCPGCYQDFSNCSKKCLNAMVACAAPVPTVGSLVCIGVGIGVGIWTGGIGGWIVGGICEVVIVGTTAYVFQVCSDASEICNDNCKLVYKSCCKEDCDKPVK
jgi:RHS repeat-associated protein